MGPTASDPLRPVSVSFFRSKIAGPRDFDSPTWVLTHNPRERRDGIFTTMDRGPHRSPPERTPYARRPFARDPVATTNAALPSQTDALLDDDGGSARQPAGDPRYLFSANRPDRCLWVTLDTSFW